MAIRGATAHRYDAQTGASRGSVGGVGAIQAACDGVTIVVLVKDGRAKRYDAKTGGLLGSDGSHGATSVGVSAGIIVIGYGERFVRYNARTGASIGGI